MTSFAKALYDNEAETDDELSFRRNDVMEVLEKDFRGLEGWWLCRLRGKTGLAPSNRLQLTTNEIGNFHKASVPVGQRVVGGGNYDYPMSSTAHHPPQGNRRKRGGAGGEPGVGSCEDLVLPIAFPDGGSGRKQDCGGASGKARSGAGADSCDDLMFISIASGGVDVGRDYDTPTSIASGNSSRWKHHPENSVSGKTEAVTKKEKSIGFGQRSRRSGVHQVKGDATSVKPKTFIERDSFLADYDVPKSDSQPPGDRIIIRKDAAGISLAQRGSQVKDYANRETRKLSHEKVSSCQTNTSYVSGDQGFMNDLNKVRAVVDDVISHSSRWTMSRNPETVRLIVRQACLSVWTKLQAFLVSFSTLLVKTRGPTAALKDHLGSLKVFAGRIEEILACIARCRPNEASLDFAKELDATAQDIRTHIDRCTEILTDPMASAPSPNAPVEGYESPRPRTPVSSTGQKTSFERRAGASLGLDQVKTMADVLASRKTHKVTSSKTPPPIRYPQKPSSPEAVGIRRAERRHATDDVKVSRGAVVFGEDRNYFRILDRSCPDSPTTPSKLVAQSSSSSAAERLDLSESVDYDLPRTRAEAKVGISGNAGSRGASEAPIDDHRVAVEFYRTQVVVVLKQLNATYRSVVESLGADSDGRVSSGSLAAGFRTLVVGFRNLCFICDALDRSAAASATIRKKVRSHSLALVNETRSIVQTFMHCVGAKWQPVSRKLFLERIDEMLRHSMVLPDVLY